jgi:hypothetical protein
MEEAERIAREEHGSVKLAVISGKLIRPRCGSLLNSQKVLAHEITTED